MFACTVLLLSLVAPPSEAFVAQRRPLRPSFYVGSSVTGQNTKLDVVQQKHNIEEYKQSLFSQNPISTDEMLQMLQELEALNNECTEECNQTNEECDVEIKAQREALIEKLEYKIAKSRTDIDQVKAYLAGPEPQSLEEMSRMLSDLETINNECTEECNQTNEECDVEVKAEREALMETLEYRIAKSRTDVDEVKAYLAGSEPPSLEDMSRMLQDLEIINNECTEECNQTNEECDVEVKAERETFMEQLEYIIAKSRTDVDEVKAYLAGSEPQSLEDMTRMVQDLETVNNECTEDCNQTNEECDVEVKAEREALMEQLEYMIARSRTDVDTVKEYLSGSEPISLEDMSRMLHDLEVINHECTEECNQTNDECDVEVKAEREALMEILEYRIAKSRTDVDEVKAYLAGSELHSLEDMARMLQDLETVNNECTEDCNQTNEECDVEVKAEREALMEQLEYMIARSRTDVDTVKEYLSGSEPISLEDMSRMLHDLEVINHECTEECNQTNDECDVEVKAEREALMEILEYRIAKSRTDVDEVKAYLAGSELHSLEDMARMLQDLETVNNECTEDCNQTNEECDVEVKAEREALMEQFEYMIARSRTDVDTVKEYLSGTEPLYLEDMSRMLRDLETVNSECTEECNQTNDECDVAVKAEREMLMATLEELIELAETSVAPEKVVDDSFVI